MVVKNLRIQEKVFLLMLITSYNNFDEFFFSILVSPYFGSVTRRGKLRVEFFTLQVNVSTSKRFNNYSSCFLNEQQLILF